MHTASTCPEKEERRPTRVRLERRWTTAAGKTGNGCSQQLTILGEELAIAEGAFVAQSAGHADLARISFPYVLASERSEDQQIEEGVLAPVQGTRENPIHMVRRSATEPPDLLCRYVRWSGL